MDAQLELKEIIWEITSECNNGCSYCGSKDQCNQKTNDDVIRQIAIEISKYTPKELNISGGDPLLVSEDTHAFIVNTLPDVKLKIIVNPKSINKYANSYSILKKYDVIGISINNQEEFNVIREIFNQLWSKTNKKPTIITNFNVLNIFMFDQIKDFCKTHDLIWQVQFTICSDDSQLGLYMPQNELACEFLFEKINKALDNNIKIVLADNMNNGKCSAGINSLGILSDGSIVPCLSMRSWATTEECIEENILNNQTSFGEFSNLGVIWQSKFSNQRFNTFKCCKDVCNNKCFKKTYIGSKILDDLKKTIDDSKEDDGFHPVLPYAPFPEKPIVMMYGVVDNITSKNNYKSDDSRMVYGVKDNDITGVNND